MKTVKYIYIVLASMLMLGCASPQPMVAYKVKVVQAEISPALFESVEEPTDGMDIIMFNTLTLSQRFVYFGEKIINLQKALDNANAQILKIKEVYLDNKKIVDKTEAYQ